jgi:hypothetical protein
VTVVEAISAAGVSTPPMVILTGIRHQRSFYNFLHDDTIVGNSDTGYTNDVLSIEWLKHWELHSRKTQVGAKRLLVMDGYGSHCTFEFIEYCNQHGVIPFSLPPHMSHLMQPLDVTVFQPYKHWHSEAIDAAIRTGCTDFNRVEFLAAFETFRRQALKSSTIKAGFEKTGLWPWQPEHVLRKIILEYEPPRPATPPAQQIQIAATPHTVRSL